MTAGPRPSMPTSLIFVIPLFRLDTQRNWRADWSGVAPPLTPNTFAQPFCMPAFSNLVAFICNPAISNVTAFLLFERPGAVAPIHFLAWFSYPLHRVLLVALPVAEFRFFSLRVSSERGKKTDQPTPVRHPGCFAAARVAGPSIVPIR